MVVIDFFAPLKSREKTLVLTPLATTNGDALATKEKKTTESCDRLAKKLLNASKTRDAVALTQMIADHFTPNCDDDSDTVAIGVIAPVVHLREFLQRSIELLLIQGPTSCGRFFYYRHEPIDLCRWLRMLCTHETLSANDGVKRPDGSEHTISDKIARRFYASVCRDLKEVKCASCSNASLTTKCENALCKTNFIMKYEQPTNFVVKFCDGSKIVFPKFLPTFTKTFLDELCFSN